MCCAVAVELESGWKGMAAAAAADVVCFYTFHHCLLPCGICVAQHPCRS